MNNSKHKNTERGKLYQRLNELYQWSVTATEEEDKLIEAEINEIEDKLAEEF